MRAPIQSDGPLHIRAIAGARVVLMAVQIAEDPQRTERICHQPQAVSRLVHSGASSARQ